jgi:hypothetical protein
MATAKRKRTDVGFDVDRAIDKLHRAAFASGALPKADPDIVAPEITAAAHLHGVGPKQCTDYPCRLGGLCHALLELTQYRAELKSLKPLVEAAERTEEMRKWLRNEGYRYAKTLNAWIELGGARHDFERKIGAQIPMHDHQQLCEQPRRILYCMTALLKSFEGVDPRKVFQSSELRQPTTRKRGALLLAAVWQHLDWGGLPYEEIFELVPSFVRTQNAKDVVRDHIARPSNRRARSILPRELHPELKGPNVNKQRRRRSPT